jgi:hypothetical protein
MLIKGTTGACLKYFWVLTCLGTLLLGLGPACLNLHRGMPRSIFFP